MAGPHVDVVPREPLCRGGGHAPVAYLCTPPVIRAQVKKTACVDLSTRKAGREMAAFARSLNRAKERMERTRNEAELRRAAQGICRLALEFSQRPAAVTAPTSSEWAGDCVSLTRACPTVGKDRAVKPLDNRCDMLRPERSKNLALRSTRVEHAVQVKARGSGTIFAEDDNRRQTLGVARGSDIDGEGSNKFFLNQGLGGWGHTITLVGLTEDGINFA